MNFDESTTKVNLARSFAAECQAGARYQFMAKQAQSEELEFLKSTFKTLAKNEMAHAKLFYNYIIENAKDYHNIPIEAGYPFVNPVLCESLPNEAQFELFEAEKVYPSFARVAKDEGFLDIAKSFEQVAEIEKSHAKINKFFADGYKNKSLYKSKTPKKWKCSNCGYEQVSKEAQKTCPVCSLPQGYVEICFDSDSVEI